MKKLFSFCAAMLLALAVNVQADTYSIACNTNKWNPSNSNMTEVSTGLFMIQMNPDTLSGWQPFKIVKNGSEWIGYTADKVNNSLSDESMFGIDDGYGAQNFCFNLLDSTISTIIYWDATNDKAYVKFDLSTLPFCAIGNTALGLNEDPTVAGNDMTYNGDGTYSLVKNNVALTASTDYWYKVTAFHAWNQYTYGDPNDEPYHNKYVNVAQSGDYEITFTFDWSTKTVSANAVLLPPVVKLAGSFFSGATWAEGAQVMADAANHLTCSYSVALNPGRYEFKIIDDEVWYGANGDVKRTDCTNWTLYKQGDQDYDYSINTGIIADVEGIYEFVYTYATKKLDVIYPTSFTRTTTSDLYYQTLCVPFDATITNADVYEITAATTSSVTLGVPDLAYMAAGNSYIIKPKTNAPMVITMKEGGASTITPNNPVSEESALYGRLGEALVYDHAADGNPNWTIYILFNNEFCLVSGTATATILSTRAHLHVILPPQQGSAPEAIRIVMEGNEATNINNIEAVDEAVKFFQNGKLFIKKNGVVYDMMGAVVK